MSPKEKLAELFKKFATKSSLSVEKAKKDLINYSLVFSPEFAQLCRSAGKTIDELSKEEHASFVEKVLQIKELNGTLHEYGVIEDFVSSLKGSDLRTFIEDVEDSLKTTLTSRNKGVSDKKAELKVLQEQRLEEVPVTVLSGYKMELEGYNAKKILIEEEKRKKLEFEKEEALLASAKKAFESIVIPPEPQPVELVPVNVEDLSWAHKTINSYGVFKHNEGAKGAVKEFDEDIAKKEAAMSGRSQSVLNEIAELNSYIDFWTRAKRNIAEISERCPHCGTLKKDIVFSESDLIDAKERLIALEKKAEAFKALTRMKEQRERIAKTIVEMDIITEDDIARANDIVAKHNAYSDATRVYNQKKATRDALLDQQKARRDEYNSLAKKGRTPYSQSKIDEEAFVSEKRDMLIHKIAIAERASENVMKIKHAQSILNDREKEVAILKEFQKVIPPFKVVVLNSVLNEFKNHAKVVLGKDIVITDDAFGYQVGDTLIDIKAMSGGERLIFTCSVIAAMINSGNAERLLLLEANELDLETTKGLVISLSSSGLFDHAFVTSHYAVDIEGVQEVWMEDK